FRELSEGLAVPGAARRSSHVQPHGRHPPHPQMFAWGLLNSARRRRRSTLRVCKRPRAATPDLRVTLLRFGAGPLGSCPCGHISTGQWGAPLMFAYLPDVLTYLIFGIVMAACLWFVDSTLRDDAD